MIVASSYLILKLPFGSLGILCEKFWRKASYQDPPDHVESSFLTGFEIVHTVVRRFVYEGLTCF